MRLGTPGQGPAQDDDAGFTIIELVVALSILAIGIFSTMQVFLGSLATTAYSDSRTRATAFAAREIEGMRAAPYAQVGFSATAPGYVASITEGSETYNTVVVSAPVSTPQGTPEVVAGVTFAIRRDIVWVSLGSAANAFKRVIATVTWTDRAGTHSVRQDAGVYPGGLGVHGGAGATTTTTAAASVPSDPTGFTATLNSLTPTTAVDLTWTAGTVAPAYWELGYSANGGTTWVSVTTSQPAGTRTYALSNLSPGTEYRFRVRGINGGLNSLWSETTATTQTQAADPTCTVLSAAVSPTSVKKKNDNSLQHDLVVNVNTSGVCTGLLAEFPATTTFDVVMTRASVTFSYTEDKDAHTWSTGPKTIRILSSTGTQLATISLVVENQ